MLSHNSRKAWAFLHFCLSYCFSTQMVNLTDFCFLSQFTVSWFISTTWCFAIKLEKRKEQIGVENGSIYLPANLSFAKRWLLSIQGKLRLPSPGTALAMGGGTAAVRGLWAGTLITPPGARVKFTPYGLDSSYGAAIPWNVPVSVVYGVALAPVGLPRW